MAKKYKYKITITFESEAPMKEVKEELIQFENALEYFVEPKSKNPKKGINNTFIYGSGKIRFQAITKKFIENIKYLRGAK